ncbi:PREDICTED: cytochrome P450 71B28-like [Camelina sativa]|uniref:Cytochrome P450 71B28-like n=1 Tax=Camelina sativa TaxID=90675 RepID=A0ABM0YJG1_CAMSA|nr:PREDICTED: cytochrome P450 71B28-like [Camelina sativa]
MVVVGRRRWPENVAGEVGRRWWPVVVAGVRWKSPEKVAGRGKLYPKRLYIENPSGDGDKEVKVVAGGDCRRWLPEVMGAGDRFWVKRRSPVNLEKTLFTLIGNIVSRIGFGINLCECDFVDEDRIVDLVHKFEEVIEDSLFSDFFPGRIGRLIDRISGQNKRLTNLFSELDTFYQNILDHHLKPGRERSYIIDVMIDMMKKQEKDGDAFKFTTDNLKGMIADIFIAGVGASAATAVWAVTELIRNPKVMKKVQDEIRTTLGDKKERITEEDLNQLRYFKLMVREVFRLHPSSPLLLPRETLSHVKIQGYDIPAKTQIIINAYAIARDPKLWENPDEFNPDRFLDSSIDYKGLNFEFIPFGSGRRICPGMTTGIMLVELALLNLLYFFDWGLPEMDEANEIVTGKEDVLIFVQVLRH